MPLFEDPVLPKSRLLLFQTVFALAQRREKEEDCLKGKEKGEKERIFSFCHFRFRVRISGKFLYDFVLVHVLLLQALFHTKRYAFLVSFLSAYKELLSKYEAKDKKNQFSQNSVIIKTNQHKIFFAVLCNTKGIDIKSKNSGRLHCKHWFLTGFTLQSQPTLLA